MKTHRAIALSLLSIGLWATAGCTVPGDATTSTTPTTPIAVPNPATLSASAAEGAALYARYCAACHGPDGIALASPWTPNLNSQGLLVVADDRFLYDSIALGRPGANEVGQVGTKMPVFKDILKAEEIHALVDFMRAWQTEPSIALTDDALVGDARAGATTYSAQCASCHGDDGWGTEAPRLAGATFQATASDAFIAHTIRHGRAGTRMLAYPLADTELADLVAFIRTLGDVPATP